MSERGRLRRDAVTRARFFLKQARSCRYSDDMGWQEPFEAYMEAAIIFGRVALQRLKKSADRQARQNPSLRAEFKAWWGSIEKDPAVRLRSPRKNFIVHEGPPKVGQIIGLGDPVSQKAEAHYYYENPDIL